MYPVNPSGVWQSHGRGFSMGIIEPAVGRTVRLTGQVAWDRDEKIVGPGDVRVQTRQCFSNIQKVLAEIGGTLEDIVEITTWFTDRSQLPIVQEVRSEFLSTKAPPVSTSIMVTGLGHPDFLVELTPVAVVPLDRLRLVNA